MKIVLSYDEAVEGARRHYNLPSQAVIVIRKKSSGPVKEVQEKIVLVKSLGASGRFTDSGHQIPLFLENNRPLSAGSFNNHKTSFDYLTSCLPHNKIGAIKELRSLSGYGLKESKDAIENWDNFHTYLIRYNKFPTVESVYQGGGNYVVTFK